MDMAFGVETETMASGGLQLNGRFEGFSGIYARGWVYSEIAPLSAVDVVVRIGGVIVAEGCANLSSSHVGDDALSMKGFSLPIPGRYFSGERFKVEILVEDAAGGIHEFDNNALDIGSDFFDGFFDGVRDGKAVGWCCPRSFSGACTVELIVDGISGGSALASAARADLAPLGIHAMRSAFEIPLPPVCFDGQPHEIEVRCLGIPLTGSVKTYQACYRGYIDDVNQRRITGWIINTSAGSPSVELDLVVNGRKYPVSANVPRKDLMDEFGTIHHGFYLDLSRADLGSDRMEVSVFIRDTDVLLSDGALTFYSQSGLASLESRVMAAIGVASGVDTENPSPLLRNFVSASRNIAALVGLLPIGRPVGEQFYGPEELALGGARGRVAGTVIAVSVSDNDLLSQPAADLVARLRAYDGEAAMPIVIAPVVVPGSAIANFLDMLDLEGIRWLGEADFVAAYLDGTIGGPLDRSVRFLQDLAVLPISALPAPEFLRKWARLLKASPTLSSLSLAAGSDFTPYVSGQGLPGVVCGAGEPQVVYLKGPRTGAALFNGALIRLGSLSDAPPTTLADLVAFWRQPRPGLYMMHGLTNALVTTAPLTELKTADFVSSADMAAFRATVEAYGRHALLADDRPTIVHLIHNMRGGIIRHCVDLATLLNKKGIRSLFLRPLFGKLVDVFDPVSGLGLRVSVAAGLGELSDLLGQMRVASVHFHHIINHEEVMWGLPAALGVPYDFTVHDYYWICPRVTLIDDTGRYCGEPATDTCDRCIASNGTYDGQAENYRRLGASVSSWRRHFSRIVAAARHVFVPSADTADRMRRYIPEANIQVLTHAEAAATTEHRPTTVLSDRIGVAVIGGIGPHKGMAELLQLAKWCERRSLDFHFTIIGTVADAGKFAGLGNVSITGAYEVADLPRLIQNSGCQLALYLSVWPETYCYTLSEALVAGLMPVAYDVGAIGARIREAGVGVLIPLLSAPENVVAAMRKAFDIRSTMQRPLTIKVGMSHEQYIAVYRQYVGL